MTQYNMKEKHESPTFLNQYQPNESKRATSSKRLIPISLRVRDRKLRSSKLIPTASVWMHWNITYHNLCKMLSIYSLLLIHVQNQNTGKLLFWTLLPLTWKKGNLVISKKIIFTALRPSNNFLKFPNKLFNTNKGNHTLFFFPLNTAFVKEN